MHSGGSACGCNLGRWVEEGFQGDLAFGCGRKGESVIRYGHGGGKMWVWLGGSSYRGVTIGGDLSRCIRRWLRGPGVTVGASVQGHLRVTWTIEGYD